MLCHFHAASQGRGSQDSAQQVSIKYWMPVLSPLKYNAVRNEGSLDDTVPTQLRPHTQMRDIGCRRILDPYDQLSRSRSFAFSEQFQTGSGYNTKWWSAFKFSYILRL